ncbi:MAG: DUF349 domain-containing protein [Desulfurivibrionaceae bacterium]|nr:DUF349 domain-containing protein [Desulfurivibrionaceae bacterium]
MALLDFKKPKYLHKDPAVRLAAIGEIDPGETEVLGDLSVNDPDHRVRCGAIARLADPAALERLTRLVEPAELPVVVARREQLLHDLVMAGTDPALCRESLRQISSPQLLASIAVNHGLSEIRRDGVERIDDQQLLAEVLEQHCGKEPARAAMAKISNEELLNRLSKSAAGKTARQLAGDKLAAIERLRNQPSRREIVHQTLAGLATEAATLLASIDLDRAAAQLELIKGEWRNLDPDGSHPDYAVFRQTCDDFARNIREIEERRATEREKARQHEKLQTGLAEICATIERLTGATDPGAESEKDRAVSRWQSLLEETAGKATPSAGMSKRFAKVCRAFEGTRAKIRREREQIDAIEQNRQRVQELIETGAFKKAAACLAKAEKMAAPVKFKYFPATATLKPLSETAAELGRAERENRERNLVRRRQICADLEKLAGALDNRTERQLQDLRQGWWALPDLEGEEVAGLEERFRKGVAELTGKLESFQQERDWQLWANLTLKEKLTERVEALDREEDLAAVFKAVREVQEEWRKIGPAPHQKSQELWDRFHAACDRNFKRTEPYLAERKAGRAAAMERRRQILAQAAKLSGSTDWRQTTDLLKELRKEWQALPRGARREEGRLFKQFRKECDRFFARRQEAYLEREQERRAHLLGKEKLCEEAECLAAAPQPEYAKKFRDLQAAWKKAGPVPREEADKIWSRFRTACDRYFSWLDEERQGNLARKEELCRQVEELVAGAGETGSREEVAARLAGIERQWQEIGPAPREEGEAIGRRFRELTDSFRKARQQEIEWDNEQRRLNLNKKEELLARAEELAGRGTGKKIVARLEKLQEEWVGTGAAPRESDRELNERFKTLCAAFYGGHRQYFSDLKKERFENQKKKESLCLRLENILGEGRKAGGEGRDRALSLADELKQAMQDNFMLAGRRNEKKAIHEEVRRIERDWRKIGPVPYEQASLLARRFNNVLERYYRGRRAD